MRRTFDLEEFIVREADGVVGAEGEAPKPASPSAPAPTWQEKRIAELTAKLHAEKAKNAAFVQTEPAAQAAPQPDLQAMARQIAEANAFDAACNEAALAGREAFGVTEFNSRVADLSSLIDRTDHVEATRYNTFLQIAIDTGEAPKIIHQLGGDKAEAARILGLSPGKMAVALAKMVTKAEAKVQEADEVEVLKTKVPSLGEVSRAPKPITPMGARSASNSQISPDDPEKGVNLDKATWFAKREAQIAEVRKAGRRMQ